MQQRHLTIYSISKTLGIEGKYFNGMKIEYDKPMTSIISNREKQPSLNTKGWKMLILVC